MLKQVREHNMYFLGMELNEWWYFKIRGEEGTGVEEFNKVRRDVIHQQTFCACSHVFKLRNQGNMQSVSHHLAAFGGGVLWSIAARGTHGGERTFEYHITSLF